MGVSGCMNARALWLLALIAACDRASPKDPPVLASKYQQVMDKYGIQVASGAMPADAEFMCSADYKVHPHSELHVVPTYNADLPRYVGSFRCNADWKQAIAETRARFAHDPTDDEGAAILQVFIERGVTDDQLRARVAGKPMRDAIPAVLDALEAGELVLAP
jgi:hypothetical protein